MRALTIKQPWVHAIFHLGKDVENRSWPCQAPRWIAIHASQKPDRDAEYPKGIELPEPDELPLSAIVGVAHLSEVRKTSDSRWFYRPGPGEKNLAWILSEVRALEKPIPLRGRLNLWEVPADVARKIRKQFPDLDFGDPPKR